MMPLDRLRNRVINRDAVDLLSAFARSHAGDDVAAVGAGILDHG